MTSLPQLACYRTYRSTYGTLESRPSSVCCETHRLSCACKLCMRFYRYPFEWRTPLNFLFVVILRETRGNTTHIRYTGQSFVQSIVRMGAAHLKHNSNMKFLEPAKSEDAFFLQQGERVMPRPTPNIPSLGGDACKCCGNRSKPRQHFLL